jgi:Tol biopolymer transport system component
VTQLTESGHVGSYGLATDGSYVYCIQRSPGRDTLSRVPVSGGTLQPLNTEFNFPEILDISPDRTSLLLSNGVGEDVPLWIVPTNGSPPRRLGDTVGHVATWAPDGKSIVFTRGDNLFGIGSDGTGMRKLLDRPGHVIDIRWSPVRGADILRFSSRPGGLENSISEMRSDGTHVHPLFPGTRVVSGSKISEDYGRWLAGGKYFVFRSRRDSAYSLLAVRENRRGLVLPGVRTVSIHSSTSGIEHPTPAPDSKRIYFISGLERRQFVRFDRARGEFVPYLHGVAGRWAIFSPDGRWLAYTVAPQETLWLSRADGSDARQIATPGLYVGAPSWSADGRFILFNGDIHDGRAGIYRVAVAGGAPEKLTPNNAEDVYPSCSPDGRSMLFRHVARRGEHGGGLYLMDWATRKTSFLPGSVDLLYGFWSPQGRYIVAPSGSELRLFDTQTQRWTVLGPSLGFGMPFWSKSGKYVFIQNQFEAEQPIFRVRITGGGYERVTSSQKIPQSDVTSYFMGGLTPDDSPIAAVVRKNEDIYALELDWP